MIKVASVGEMGAKEAKMSRGAHTLIPCNPQRGGDLQAKLEIAESRS